MLEDKYTKSLAKNQACAIIHMRGLLVLSQCGHRKPAETYAFEFSYLCVNSSLEELIKIKVIFI